MSKSVVPNSGRVVFIEEIGMSEYAKLGASVRVTGRVKSYDVASGIVFIEDRERQLQVEVSSRLPSLFNVPIGSLAQFIGELEVPKGGGGGGGLLLHARICRNVDGLNLELYRKSVDLLRNHIGQPL